MNKHYKVFAIFALLISLIFFVKLYTENISTLKIKELSIKYEAQSIADFLVAFRTTYQKIFIKNHTKLDASNIEFLPVKTTNEIARIFSDLNTKSKIATVSSRPRNPVNMANTRQLEAINSFQKDKTLQYTFKSIDDKYYYSQPLYITKTCLKCHGKKEDAPAIIQNTYNRAYDYKLGDLRGIIDIEVSQTKLGIYLEENNSKRASFVFMLLFGILLISFFYARYNKKLEERIENEIIKNRQQNQQLIQQSRLAQMGEMISMIAHQWRQPLTAISATTGNLSLKLMIDDMDKKEFQQEIELIEGYAHHLSSTIDDFRGFFKENKAKEYTSFDDIVQSTLTIAKISAENKNITIKTNLNAAIKLETFASELKQVLLNLIKNAEDALVENNIENPTIMIVTSVKDNIHILRVKDNAGGISADVIDNIFDPYFSTKLEKDGTGLGLYMSKTIVQEHCQGDIMVANDKDGAEFTIQIKGNL